MKNKITFLSVLVMLGSFISASADPYRAPGYGADPYGYGADPYRAPGYGADPYRAPGYGADPYGAPDYGAPVRRHRSFYKMGKRAAKALARSAWDNIRQDCTRTSLFVQIVGDGVDDAVNDIGTRYRGPSAEDFGHGFIDGLMEVLDRVVDRCVHECQMIGNASGEWSAKMFCRIAWAIGRAPTFTVRLVNIRGSICGGAYRLGCESSFVGTATGMCPVYARGPSFHRFYRAANNGSCSYNPY